MPDPLRVPGQSLTVSAADGILANDVDVQGLTLQVASHTNPSSGYLVLNGNGSFTYTPDPGFSGTDTFTYTNTNGVLNSETATVAILVANQPIVTAPDAFRAKPSGPTSVVATFLAANDSNPDHVPVTYHLDGGPSHGTLTLSLDGSFAYTAAAGYNGLDHFGYYVNDGKGQAKCLHGGARIACTGDNKIAAEPATASPHLAHISSPAVSSPSLVWRT